ncbi:MAG: methyltransferase, partial [Pseudomonadota bacterium]
AKPGAQDRRAFVGPPEQYDFMGATQFRLLTSLGLVEDHTVLDIGCGSLRAGRFLIQYLMPGRYIGVEPNSWLWQEAFAREIGTDVQTLKAPRFLDESDFRLTGLDPASVDTAVAQSIYSHTGRDTFSTSLRGIARVLKPQGQALFTVVDPAQATKVTPKGIDSAGWIYPGCVTYGRAAVLALCKAAGLHVQRLDWFHPRQTWYRAVRDPDLRLNRAMRAALGTGRPLFDPRFAAPKASR